MRWMMMGVLLAAGAARADVQVMTDIAPVQSLVARVMQGADESPDMILPVGASPHHYALRPSQVRSLGKAGLVVWVGPSLTPWLERSLDATEASVLALSSVDGVTLLPFREGVAFAGDHDHGDTHEEGAPEDQDDHEGHEDHKGHDHAEEHDDEHHAEHAEDHHGHDDDHADHDKHDGAHEDHDEDAHADHHDGDHDETHAKHHGDEEEHSEEHHHDDHAGAMDPHLWLDPVIAQVWVQAIADKLAALDVENAALYQSNAKVAVAELQALNEELHTLLEPVEEVGFILLHDALHYFEDRYHLNSVAAISLGDASAPTPARISALRDLMAEQDVACVFGEVGESDRLLRLVSEGTGLRQGILSLLGDGDASDPAYYPNMLRKLANDLHGCLAG